MTVDLPQDAPPIDPDLASLADAHGVAYQYEDSALRRVDVDPGVVVRVLGLLGVDAGTSEAISQALEAVRLAAQSNLLPPTVVLTAGDTRPLPATGDVICEDGSARSVGLLLPDDLPLGWHRLRCAGQEVTLIVVPRALPVPPSAWGWMLQLYAVHSARSWGMGDLGDLTEFIRDAGPRGAGFVLLNPLHAVAPTLPVQASPYSPSSRRFLNPLYLRISDVEAYRAADAELRARVDALNPATRDGDATDLIDYDAIWTAKRSALELLFPHADPPAIEPGDRCDFATYCALAEIYGPGWQSWPEPLRTPNAEAVAEFRAEHPERIVFHSWLQHLGREQLATAAAAATEAGMPVGVVHDLAVGVDPGGADGWMLGDLLADGVRVGAPPDDFNQLGQDWGLAAWAPHRLAETGYAAYRDLLRSILSRAGGIRVDHVAGLFRLWWIPPHADATGGTYVSYDAEAMLGILALEAYRAGAVVIGEDLGTVSAAVTEGLQSRNMLGSTVLWFARAKDADAAFIAPQDWPRNAFASISTHDLPTASGFLTGEHVRVRAGLGLLARDEADEQKQADTDRAELLAMLATLGPEPMEDQDQMVVRMHSALAASPSTLIAASLYDVLGEVRQPNLPGTVDQYPNWRQPLPVPLEEIFDDPRVIEISRLLSAARPR